MRRTELANLKEEKSEREADEVMKGSIHKRRVQFNVVNRDYSERKRKRLSLQGKRDATQLDTYQASRNGSPRNESKPLCKQQTKAEYVLVNISSGVRGQPPTLYTQRRSLCSCTVVGVG